MHRAEKAHERMKELFEVEGDLAVFIIEGSWTDEHTDQRLVYDNEAEAFDETLETEEPNTGCSKCVKRNLLLEYIYPEL